MEPTPFSLHGKRALITGGGRGIGRACAVALARSGAEVAVSSRTQGQLEETAGEISSHGGRVTVIRGDIGSQKGVEQLAKDVGNWGDIDILVNSAAVSPTVKAVEAISLDEWTHILDTNLTGTFGLIRHLCPPMLSRGSGSVVNITSIAAERALPKLAAYAASKAALGELTRSMAVEWAAAGVRVNAVAPAYIETEMTAAVVGRPKLYQSIIDRTPMGRWGRSDEVAWAVVFLASDAASYITGHTLFVDGGWTSL